MKKMMMLMLLLMLAVPAAAQTGYGTQSTVTSSDIQRLQDQVYDASTDIARMRSGDRDRLQSQLDDVRDEVVYLKVKMRKEGSVSRSDYDDVRDRLQNIRTEARGDSSTARQGSSTGDTNGAGTSNNSGYGTGSSSGAGAGYGTGSGSGTGSSSGYYGGTSDRQRPSSTTARRGEVPAGQEVDVRLERELTSDTAQVEDRFTATTMVDLYQGDEVLIPAGSTMRGVVSSVTNASHTQRKGSLTVSFDQITVRGRNYPIRGTVTQALESEGIKGELPKIGAGAGVGAILGGILGGAKGALLGVLIGGGGTIAATEGKDVELPVGTVLRVKFDDPVMIK